MVFQNSVPCSSATRLVQVHWLEVLIRLHLHHRGPLLSDGGNVVENGTCNNNVTGPVRCNPQTLQTLKSFLLLPKGHFKCVPLSWLELHCNGFVVQGLGQGMASENTA